jgi:hypothetical protein
MSFLIGLQCLDLFIQVFNLRPGGPIRLEGRLLGFEVQVFVIET